MARPHAVVVPYPGSGNINPALQLSKLLRRHGVFITFVVTEHNLHRAQAAAAAEGAAGGCEGFRIEAIPDGMLDADRDAQDYDLGLSKATTHRCAAPLRELVARLRDGSAPGVPPVTCVLPTTLMSFALDVARELGVPSMVLVAFGAAPLMAQMRIRELKERGYLPLKDESCLTNGYLDKTIIDWIPGMPPISLGDVSSFVRTTDPDDFGLWFNITEANNCTKASAIIINTFDALEADVLGALRAEYPRIYTVGQLGTMLHRSQLDEEASDDSIDLSLWKHDTECLAWLDTQEPGSVVYANFGSLTVLTADQLAEFAWGLAATGHPFLMVVREDLVHGGGALPPEFLAETAERCRVVTWCPQEQVLRHRAVGCFLTHCGWNSMLESIAAGVPMVCWPVFADQYVNRKYACELWGIGLRLDEEVRREQVAGRVREAMESEEMRKSAARWKAEAEAAACPGGSSHENLLGLVKALKEGSLNSEA
ncbi:7-deoxyloganetin glucosyltransferase-like [Panicum miliaceum]|uniref:Glycosyltransferase n=1 Tax=Panicum miliaceum TaxID=4540 RepID=A0A3L6RIJ5_PANMI|nr:7-deoxyloganetin glucosyltransferase-like [Panicum miliaceum]